MKPHKDLIRNKLRSAGQSIRVGKKVPVNSANLAYVSTKPVSPEENLLIEDRSSYIQENGLPTYVEKEVMAYPNQAYRLESESGQSVFPSDNLHVTDEFTVRRHVQDTEKPLYFLMECKGRFDAKGSYVLPYVGGRSTDFTSQAVKYEELSYDDQADILYMGELIRVQNETGSNANLSYKVHLIRDGNSTLYRILIYTDFRGDKDNTYKVTYPSYVNGKVTTKEEVLNAYPFFERIEYDQLMDVIEAGTAESLSKKQYSIVETSSGYEVYASSQVMIANAVTRPPQWFKYRTEAKLKTKLSETNKGKLRMGVIYLNTTVFNVENLYGVGKVLANSALKPSYLTVENPHPIDPSWLPSDVRYWQADLDMPAHQYYDYDVLFLTGYGTTDLSAYRDYFEDYLSQGGVIWLDNGGEGVNALNFTVNNANTFVTNVGFSTTATETGSKRFLTNESYRNRFYLLPENITDLGYEKVLNKITFGAGERLDNWTVHVQFGSGGPALMERTLYSKGKLMVSNCGILRSVYHNDDFTMKFIFNVLLTHAENQWFFSPWRQDYVYHRDNLFEQEYQDVLGNQVYVDDRHDLDVTQIVAKKQLGKTCRDMLLPHVKTWFQTATGTYYPVIESDNEISIENNDFEAISINSSGVPITQWTATTANAIPGWNTKVFAGATPTFKQVDNITARGVKSVYLSTTNASGTQSFWESADLFLPADTYEITGWVKTSAVSGLTTDGAKIGIYLPNGTMVAKSVGVSETRNWTEVKFSFTLSASATVKIRLGFVDGNGLGTVYFDNITMFSKGSVHITPTNIGEKSLYAYAIKPKGETIDIRTQGFVEEDIARIQPSVPFKLYIRSFVYKWQNLTRRYEREYGNSASYNLNINKAEGIKTYGYLHSMLPPLLDGAEWQDKNRVYYELIAYGDDGFVNPLVNVSLYDTEQGKEYYLKNGELVIGYMDLYWARLIPTILIQAQTPYETIRASRRQFGLKLTNEDKIYVEGPQTKDSRESWFLRIHNGMFLKSELGYEEWAGITGNATQTSKYSARTIRPETYKIPEYDQQVFHPYQGVKTVENQVEYINRKMVKVPDNNLFVEIGSVSKEQLNPIGADRTVFEASRERWDERKTVTVYVDAEVNGTYTEVEEGFAIDYDTGVIIFEKTVTGTVQASYSYCNLRLYKRTYQNGKVVNEVLKTEDKKTYVSKRPFWLYQPAPVIKLAPGTPTKETTLSPLEYSIDYKQGVIKLNKEGQRALYADYGYYTQTAVEIEDYDVQNGIIYLKNEVSFQDDLYAEYSYEEQFYEYRGYYNSEIRQFLYLDLNPSVGHYSTLPSTSYSSGNPVVSYKTLPSAKLLNKEIHVYMVPQSMGGASIRHCFSALEWKKIQETNPMCLLLAKVFVREHTNVDQAVVMDARTRGGGLKESITEQEISKRVQGKQRYWDIGGWNGKAYYRNGTLIVRIPKKVLQSNGGQFTEEQVEQMLEKYVAYGTYTIIEYI